MEVFQYKLFKHIGCALALGVFAGQVNAMDGNLDSSFSSSAIYTTGSWVSSIAVSTDNRIAVGTVNDNPTLKVLDTVGTASSGFPPSMPSGWTGMQYYSVVFASNGDVITAGTRSNSSNQGFAGILRLDSTGSVVCSYSFGQVDSYGLGVAVDTSSGKLIVVGYMPGVYSGDPHGLILRLNGDCTLDTGFSASASDIVRAVDIQSDGKILIGGDFISVNVTTRNYIARLNADGSLDSGFDAGSFNDTVRTIALQTDGKILVGGDFTSIGGSTREYIARLDTDGSLDSTFDPSTAFTGSVLAISVQPDGKILAGGTANFLRLAPDGSLDTTFSGSSINGGNIYALAMQGDAVLVGGSFTSPTNEMARLIAHAPKNNFDGDWYSDVLFLNTSTGASQYWESANPSNSVNPGTYDYANYSYVGSGDFDGDGTADILFYKASTGDTMIWPGAVSTSPTYPGTGASGYSVMAVCDVDGDGKDDVVWVSSSNTKVWFSGDSTTVMSPDPGHPSAGGYNLVACADFDGDGKADFFWRKETTGSDLVWPNADSSQVWYPGAAFDANGYWTIVGAGDADGDGKADVIWYNTSTATVRVWWGAVESTWTYQGTASSGYTPQVIGDYDGDGKADLLWSNSSRYTKIWSGVSNSSVTTSTSTYGSGYTIQK
jgi:uncharacterized delta-60 repeat protein